MPLGRKSLTFIPVAPNLPLKTVTTISFQKNHELSGAGRTGNCLGFPGSRLPCPALPWPAFIDTRKQKLHNLPKVSPLFSTDPFSKSRIALGKQDTPSGKSYVIQAKSVENVTDIAGIVP